MKLFLLLLMLLVNESTPTHTTFHNAKYSPDIEQIQISLIFIGDSQCYFSRVKEVRMVIDEFTSLNFNCQECVIKVVGLSVDENPVIAYKYLYELYEFDEYLIGGGWFGSGINHFVNAYGIQRSVPQYIVGIILIAHEKIVDEFIIKRFFSNQRALSWMENEAEEEIVRFIRDYQ
ncbi:MAG: hypothetical protein EA364_11375 [Balneolaceae bacterium]|nr:MAG: hypothetical protein EA364_11375 [Balneolaceae bacterium]